MLLITFTPEDGKALLEKLELIEARAKDQCSPELRQEVNDIHRRFHFDVCRWLQAHGWRSP